MVEMQLNSTYSRPGALVKRNPFPRLFRDCGFRFNNDHFPIGKHRFQLVEKAGSHALSAVVVKYREIVQQQTALPLVLLQHGITDQLILFEITEAQRDMFPLLR